MKRAHLVVILCMVLIVAAIIVIMAGTTAVKPPASDERVVTQGGQITVLPAENRSKMTIVAEMPRTNASTTTKGK